MFVTLFRIELLWLVYKLFFLNGPIPAFFLFIFVFTTCYNLNSNFNWKKHRWCAWDSNLGRQDGRRKRIHWATTAPQYFYFFMSILLSVCVYLFLLSLSFFVQQKMWSWEEVKKKMVEPSWIPNTGNYVSEGFNDTAKNIIKWWQ